MSEQDVLGKVDDVLDKVVDMKEQVDELINRKELWQICGDCRGEGLLHGMKWI